MIIELWHWIDVIKWVGRVGWATSQNNKCFATDKLANLLFIFIPCKCLKNHLQFELRSTVIQELFLCISVTLNFVIRLTWLTHSWSFFNLFLR